MGNNHSKTIGSSKHVDRLTSSERFLYKRLADKKRTIRVIKIRSPEEGLNDSIRCDLKHIDLADKGHVCLSYTWGPSTSPRNTIYVNGDKLEVRRGLHEFLLKARELEISDWLWIDAISINQDDHQERGHQVRLMKEIYSLACHVLLYPGTISPAINHFFLSANLYSWRALEAYRSAIGIVKRQEFENLPYWRRVWVIQEVALARKVWVVFPTTLVAWKVIRDVMNQWPQLNSKSINNHAALRSFSSLQSSDCGFSGNLVSLIYDSRESECSDCRDRVYALLGLVDTPPAFPIDYGRRNYVVLLDVLDYFVLQSNIGTIQRLRTLMSTLFFGLDRWPAILCLPCCQLWQPSYAELLRKWSATRSFSPHLCAFVAQDARSIREKYDSVATVRNASKSMLQRMANATRRQAPWDEMGITCCICDTWLFQKYSTDSFRFARYNEDLLFWAPSARAFNV